jgi:hypothetical protein
LPVFRTRREECDVIATKRPGPYLAIAGAIALLASAGSLPAGRVAAADAPGVVISEIHPGGSGSAYAADWLRGDEHKHHHRRHHRLEGG